MGEKGVEKRTVKGIALGMVLDTDGEGIIFEPDLLDHAVVRVPRVDLEVVAKLVDGLMMGAVDLVETDFGPGGITEGLDVVVLEFVVAGDVEQQRAAEGDVENLMAAADGEDREARMQRLGQSSEIPGIPVLFRVVDKSRIRNVLPEELGGNIAATGQDQPADVVPGDIVHPRIPKVKLIYREDLMKMSFLVLFDPGGEVLDGSLF